jgi:hypothetical protein
MRKVKIIGVLSMLLVAFSASAALAISPHTVPSNPLTCTENTDRTVTCSGAFAGLGTAELVTIALDVEFACEVRPGVNKPGGHLQATQEGIEPEHGRVDFSLTTGPAECPRGLNPVVGDEALITVCDVTDPANPDCATFTVPITSPDQ